MTLLALGLNHETASINIREKISFDNHHLLRALTELKTQPEIKETAILSTCNRTELYCSLTEENNTTLYTWLHEFHGLRPHLLKPCLYHHTDFDAVRHIFRVASGLDSMVLGESQILGQLKQAYRDASETGALGKHLNRLFQYAFHVAKQVRLDTAIGTYPVSVAYAAVRVAKQIFGQMSDQTALFIGAGSTMKLVIKYLHKEGLSRMIIANRTRQNAQDLTERYRMQNIEFSDIVQHLAKADIVITATNSASTIIDKQIVQAAIKQRKHKPIFIVDLSVPRNVAEGVNELEDIYLYNIDDLKNLIQENLQHRQMAAKEAEKIVINHAYNFMRWFDSLDAIPNILQLRDKAQDIQQQVLEKSLLRLQSGVHPERVLRETTRVLTNKLIHIPSEKLKDIQKKHQQELNIPMQKVYDSEHEKLP